MYLSHHLSPNPLQTMEAAVDDVCTPSRDAGTGAEGMNPTYVRRNDRQNDEVCHGTW